VPVRPYPALVHSYISSGSAAAPASAAAFHCFNGRTTRGKLSWRAAEDLRTHARLAGKPS